MLEVIVILLLAIIVLLFVRAERQFTYLVALNKRLIALLEERYEVSRFDRE